MYSTLKHTPLFFDYYNFFYVCLLVQVLQRKRPDRINIVKGGLSRLVYKIHSEKFNMLFLLSLPPVSGLLYWKDSECYCIHHSVA